MGTIDGIYVNGAGSKLELEAGILPSSDFNLELGGLTPLEYMQEFALVLQDQSKS